MWTFWYAAWRSSLEISAKDFLYRAIPDSIALPQTDLKCPPSRGEFMVVKTQCNGREVTGLCVGTTNARRYFSKRVKSVDLQLDDLQIQCKLTPDFWHGQPEIHDPRLCEWLKFKVSHDRSSRMLPIPMDLQQFGMNSFKLVSSTHHQHASISRGTRYSPAA